MRVQKNLRKITLTTLALLLLSFPVGYSYAKSQDFSFQVHNVGRYRVVKIYASEDGKDWGYFDIGDGIAPGQTKTIVWDRSTNNQTCEQYFKAAFDDGLESPPKKFDFCEKGLVIEVR